MNLFKIIINFFKEWFKPREPFFDPKDCEVIWNGCFTKGDKAYTWNKLGMEVETKNQRNILNLNILKNGTYIDEIITDENDFYEDGVYNEMSYFLQKTYWLYENEVWCFKRKIEKEMITEYDVVEEPIYSTYTKNYVHIYSDIIHKFFEEIYPVRLKAINNSQLILVIDQIMYRQMQIEIDKFLEILKYADFNEKDFEITVK